VAFTGLAFDLARFIFFQIRVIYTLAGGPLFAIKQSDPDTSDEVERIAVFPQKQSPELVNQTIQQTAFQNHTAAVILPDLTKANKPAVHRLIN
jgi:hypothetical protein